MQNDNHNHNYMIAFLYCKNTVDILQYLNQFIQFLKFFFSFFNFVMPLWGRGYAVFSGFSCSRKMLKITFVDGKSANAF